VDAAAQAWVQCQSCGRRHRWRDELAGRVVACVCGADVPFPTTRPQPLAAVAAVRDEAAGEAGVDLGAVFDNLSEAGSDEQAPDAGRLLRKRHRGWLNLSLEAELALFGLLSLAGLACTILAIVVGKYFVPYIVAAVVVGPPSWWLFWRRWRLWTRGRTVLQALSQALSGEEEDEAEAQTR